MALPTYSFSGANFFSNIRTQMNSNQGMFAGRDGGFHYVVMDAALYRLEIFQRPIKKSFTEAGKSLGKDIRVLVSGQPFGSNPVEQPNKSKRKYEYCWTVPCKILWQGEIVVKGTVKKGKAPLPNGYHFIGRQNAIPIWRYFFDKGDPSKARPKLHFAMGVLYPLIIRGVPCTTGQSQGTPPNRTRVHCKKLKRLWNLGPSLGKVGVGLHRASGCIFVFAQEDSIEKKGIEVPSLIQRLHQMGVNSAALGDCSNTATLLVDRTVHVTPADYKNRSIPSGLMFRHMALFFRGGGTITVKKGTDKKFISNYPIGTVINFPSLLAGPPERIVTKKSGGLELKLYSFGKAPPGTPTNIAAKMGISSMPITLTTTSTDLTGGVTFSSSTPNVKLSLRLTRTVGKPDTLRGNLIVKNSRGAVNGAIVVPI